MPQAQMYSKDNEPTQAALMGGVRSAIKPLLFAYYFQLQSCCSPAGARQ